MTNEEAQLRNQSTETIFELAWLLLDIVHAISRGEITLSPRGVHTPKKSILWAPSFLLGKKIPDARYTYTLSQIACLLQRTESRGKGPSTKASWIQKPDHKIRAAFTLLAAFEAGKVSGDNFQILAKNFNRRDHSWLSKMLRENKGLHAKG